MADVNHVGRHPPGADQSEPQGHVEMAYVEMARSTATTHSLPLLPYRLGVDT